MRFASLVVVLGLLPACTSLPPPQPLSHLDERTGITLTLVDAPFILARERRDIAANARDYLTLVAATRNESGRITPALLAYRWSTIDTRSAPTAPGTDLPLVILADGRDIRLAPMPSIPREFQPSDAHDLWRPDVTQVATTVYRIDVATLRFIAQSARVSAFYDVPQDALPYGVWRDGRAALERLAAALK